MRIEIEPGTEIADAVEQLVLSASVHGETCTADFNGFELVAVPGVTDPGALHEAYVQHCNTVAAYKFTAGNELGAEIILLLVSMLESVMHTAFKQSYPTELAKARRIVAKAAQLPEAGGAYIKAARDVLFIDQNNGNRLNNGQKAMLFIAAVELMQEKAGT